MVIATRYGNRPGDLTPTWTPPRSSYRPLKSKLRNSIWVNTRLPVRIQLIHLTKNVRMVPPTPKGTIPKFQKAKIVVGVLPLLLLPKIQQHKNIYYLPK